MRVIHSALMSRFFCRRSRKAYCRAFSTRGVAILMQFFARPRKPLASCRILSFLPMPGAGPGVARLGSL